MIKTAVIMAAGKGTRFGDRTESMPKGFIEFNGIPMVTRSIENLIASGITKIIIGTGYHKEWYVDMASKYPQVMTVFSPDYADTNSMETLFRCREAIGDEGFLLLESDIVYEPRAIESLLSDSRPDVMLVSPVVKFQDQYYIGADEDSNLVKCSTDKDVIISETGKDPVGELVGIHKISNPFYKNMLDDYDYKKNWKLLFSNADDPRKIGYEFYLEDVATWQPLSASYVSGNGNIPTYPSEGLTSARSLGILLIPNLQWYEIDDIRDLEYAEKNIQIS